MMQTTDGEVVGQCGTRVDTPNCDELETGRG